MGRAEKIKEEIKKVFKKEQAKVLIAIVDIVDETVKAKDFNELKEIVRQIGVKLSELIQAQKETDQKIKELTEAQKRTDQKVAELTEAQKKTEEEVRELTRQVRALTEEMREIKMELRDVRRELGGLGKSFSYSLENEAFRMLPKFLKEKYSIEIEEKFIRKEIGGKEINIFGFGKKDGKSIVVIGEARSRIDTKEKIEEVLQDVEEKEKVVAEEYKGFDIVKIVITHFASNLSLELANQRGVIIIQSFEW
jgi:hypothetical protein